MTSAGLAEPRGGESHDSQNHLAIVDAHHHLWDLHGPIRYPWLEEPEVNWLGDYSAIRRSYLPAEYRRDAALHRVVATVHVEAEADRSQQVAETEWLIEQSATTGMPNAIVCHAWVDTPDAEEIIARQSSFPLVRGVRTKPTIAKGPSDSVKGQPRSMQDERWLQGLELLTRYGLSWDLRVPYWHLAEAAEVLRHHPELRTVLNHTGYPWDRTTGALEIWRAGMHALAERPNVWCKISALPVKDQPWTLEQNGPIIAEAIEIFGVERCMFASNFPVDSLKGSWDYLFSCYKRMVRERPLDEQIALFSGNAASFYRIELPS